ncbi:dipicolinate synthase subunit DpsA [Carboxydochorda subterranea]|uniref:Dipicolinate synthase subunit DpsA n=1 Tax=Carboxydichorda subterranea TaxID=3109565 RepID=A0ABZ1BZT5_9FIRM|nr:dipicolinate synthase subunit DpsA [Limnochorda sp. L945t]WRP18355.1 dipicolinate synthase subunit DpsA [Limnochorda sp. L945t]
MARSMALSLEGRTLVVAGGDERELALAERLLELGAGVWMVGFPAALLPPGAHFAPDLASVADRAEAVLCPLSGTDPQGAIRTVMAQGMRILLDDGVLERLRSGTLLVIGSARPALKAAAARHGIRLIELEKDEEIAVLNAVPTAEGAVQLAMSNLRVTLHGSRTVVVGYGRCGQQLCRVLGALGASVQAVVFHRTEWARAWAAGVAAIWPHELASAAGQADVIFNTAPALVVTEEVLRRMKPQALVVDIASDAGGTDFEAASRLGVQAIHALGLPGRVAPRTAGAILAQVVPGILARSLAP